MITQDPELETRLRRHGQVLRSAVQVGPTLHARFMQALDRRPAKRPTHWLAQVAVAAVMVLVAGGAVALLFRVRADQLAKAMPAVTSVAPADGAVGVAVNGEIRVTFAKPQASRPSLSYTPTDGHQDPARWDGTTLTVTYSGLHPATRYQVVVTSDYASGLGGRGHFEKRWTFTTEIGPPSASAGPLIWYATAPSRGPEPQPTMDVALNWNGTVVGMLHETGNPNQSPDGSRLLSGSDTVLDQTGAAVGHLTLLKGGVNWADDSRQACRMSTASGAIPTGNSEPAWLVIGPIGSAEHRVAQVGQFGGQSGPSVLACSPSADRAVVVEDVIMYAHEVWVLRLSTGAIVYHHVYADAQVASSVIASRDGRYLAEELMSTSSQSAVGYGDTVIRRVSDGAVVARLIRQSVVAFSWDASRVVTIPAYQSGAPNEVRVVDWQRNRVLWSHPLASQDQTGYGRVDFLARPNSADVALAVGRATTDGTPDQYEGLWIIRADGTSQQVVAGQLAPAF